MPPAAARLDDSRSSLPSLSWRGGLLAVWGLGALATLGWLALGLLRARRLGRRGGPPVDRSWRLLGERLAARVGLSRPVRILQSDEVQSPATWGWRRPTVLLPRRADEWSPQRREIVLLHELVHVRRNDWLVQVLAQLARSLHWFNPLAWVAVRRLALEREQACDETVVALGTAPSDYATHLLDIALSMPARGALPSATLAMAHRSQLEGRLMSILDHSEPRRRGVVLLPTATLMAGALLCCASFRIWDAPDHDPQETHGPSHAETHTGLHRVHSWLVDKLHGRHREAHEVHRKLHEAPHREPHEAPHREAHAAPRHDVHVERHAQGHDREDHRRQVHNEHLKKLHEHLRKLHEPMDSHHVEMEHLHRKMEPIHEHLQELHERMAPFHQEMEKVHERMAPFHERMDEIHQRMAPFHRKMEKLHERMAPFHEEMEEVHQRMAPFHERMDEIHQRMAPFHRKMEKLHERMAPFHEKMEHLHRKMEPIHEEMNHLHRKLEPLNHELMRLHERESDDHAAKIEHLEREMNPLHTELELLNERLAPFHSQLEKLELNLEPFHQDAVRLELELAPFHQDLELLNERMAPFQREMEDIEVRLAPFHDEERVILSELEPFHAQLELLEHELAPFEHELEPLEAGLEPYHAELELLEHELAPMERALEPVHEALEPLEEACEPIHREITRELERELARLIEAELEAAQPLHEEHFVPMLREHSADLAARVPIGWTLDDEAAVLDVQADPAETLESLRRSFGRLLKASGRPLNRGDEARLKAAVERISATLSTLRFPLGDRPLDR